MALLHVLARLQRQFGLLVSAHGVDHGLRAAASSELAVVAQFAQELCVPFSTSRVSLRPAGNLQARAREARYTALRQEARRVGASFVTTAHHANDRAETVLIRLLRGAGIAGLGVLPARSHDLLRPMVEATRSDVEDHLSRHRIPFSEDPSNANSRFLRVRVRQELLPLLEQLSPQIVTHLTSLADQVSVGDVPEVRDEGGRQVPLNRAQVGLVRQLLSGGRPSHAVLLSGGREIRRDRASGQLVVVPGGKLGGQSRGREER